MVRSDFGTTIRSILLFFCFNCAYLINLFFRFSDLVEKQVKAADDDPDLAKPSEEKMKEVCKFVNSQLILYVYVCLFI